MASIAAGFGGNIAVIETNSNHNRDPNKRQNPANNDRSRIHIRVKTHIVQLVPQVLVLNNFIKVLQVVMKTYLQHEAKKTDSGGIRDSTTTETPE
ncbi:16416_t:CDS:2 [Entrophospora sp. SA101]|nr:16416_t:CDS:2 [Entrophospora sp. SA101]CAJ0892969.1 3251_t:CDS:2 [Entrophospora sp. SA101]CAJ0901074.1 14773_t:CDS:2 [Entrophospora sp. SA101]